ncbi:unnamed protein product [Sphagnum troendelagicum]|uniref:Dolichyl-diphosphooligosaccharide--protein glycosyltransferase subunit 2 n=1 Tax=Sphagnum troendelagicum TaxID=128251 RepID=A0ABP0UEZ2_9BRYO
MASTASGASRLPLAWLRLLLLGWLFAVVSQTTCASNGLQPLSDADREAVAGYFTADADGFYGSLQETYHALRALEILEQSNVESQKICDSLVGLVQAPHDSVEDAFHVVRIAEVLQCPHGAEVAKVIVPSLQAAVEKAKSLLELHYSVATIAIIKGWSSKSASFNDALSGVFSSLKELAGPDGTWHYTKSSSESSAKAAGLYTFFSFPTTAIAYHVIGHIKTAAIKLFDNLESHDQGVFYFQESKDDASSGGGGTLEATWAVLRGSAALAAVLPAKLKVEVEKVFGIAKFLLTPGLALSATEAFYQLDSLSVLEEYRPAVPVSVQTSSILSLSSNDNLEVAVTTVLGKPVSQVKVTLVSAHCIGADAPPVWSSQNLNYVENSGKYVFHFLSATTDLGKYKLRLEVCSVKSEGHSSYMSGGPVKSDITVISAIGISDIQLAVLDSSTGISDFSAVLEYGKDENITLSANHLQKLRLSLKLTSPSGSPFNPQQVFLKLVHESHVEHLYLVKSSTKGFQLTLDFLGLVEKLQYLSGTYNVVLIVGDMTMENSFVWTLASLDLDLPAAPEGKPLPPEAPLEITARVGSKPEIAHIFRQPEKRPPTLLSNIFLSLTLLPLIGFFIGLGCLGANIKLFPMTGLPGVAAVGFHGAVASILVLYFLFWLKLDLFTTLKVLGFLGLCTLPPGHFILSYLADSSAKQKTA